MKGARRNGAKHAEKDFYDDSWIGYSFSGRFLGTEMREIPSPVGYANLMSTVNGYFERTLF